MLVKGKRHAFKGTLYKLHLHHAQDPRVATNKNVKKFQVMKASIGNFSTSP